MVSYVVDRVELGVLSDYGVLDGRKIFVFCFGRGKVDSYGDLWFFIFLIIIIIWLLYEYISIGWEGVD